MDMALLGHRTFLMLGSYRSLLIFMRFCYSLAILQFSYPIIIVDLDSTDFTQRRTCSKVVYLGLVVGVPQVWSLWTVTVIQAIPYHEIFVPLRRVAEPSLPTGPAQLPCQ